MRTVRLMRKYDPTHLADLVARSVSFAEVIRRLGRKPGGGNQSHIKRVVERLGISTQHFLGQRANSGATHSGGCARLHWSQVLVLHRSRYGRREDTFRLRRALIESGILERCSECGCGTTWNGKALVLHIDHRNGNPCDNRPGNPRFLCPNCHTQTENYGSKNNHSRV